MGDRALIILKDGAEFSPVVYLHWHAPQVQHYVNRLREVMSGRGSDLSYSFARLCGIIHNDIGGNTSFGVWNLPGDFADNEPYLSSMSHGDGGVYVVDINADYSIATYGGYGIENDQPSRDGGDADRVFRLKQNATV